MALKSKLLYWDMSRGSTEFIKLKKYPVRPLNGGKNVRFYFLESILKHKE